MYIYDEVKNVVYDRTNIQTSSPNVTLSQNVLISFSESQSENLKMTSHVKNSQSQILVKNP